MKRSACLENCETEFRSRIGRRNWRIRWRHLNEHRSDFETKCQKKTEQLEPRSTDGVISLTEFRIRTEVQQTVDQNWKDQMENEDKITNGKIESLHSVVNWLEQEMTILKGKHSISAASTVANSSNSGGGHVGVGIPGGEAVWSPSRVELKGWRSVEQDSRDRKMVQFPNRCKVPLLSLEVKKSCHFLA